MKTKEAIEFIEEIKEYFDCVCNYKGNGVITLLKQGEAYQMIWILFMTQIEKLIEDSFMIGLPLDDIKDIAIKKIHDLANDLEQKYFPKEDKNGKNSGDRSKGRRLVEEEKEKIQPKDIKKTTR